MENLRIMKNILFFIAFLALALSTSVNAAFITVGTSNGGIYDVDTATGAATLVATGVVMTDLARDANGGLWGVTFDNLYHIDTSTNTFTDVGALSAPYMNALTFGSDGTLYGSSYKNTNLYTIDTLSGAASIVGAGSFTSSGDLSFNAAGDMFLAADTGNDTLVDVDPLTGITTTIGSTGINDAYGLAFVDGVMYGVSVARVLYTIDTSTGVATSIGTITGISGDVYGATVSAVPIPAAVWLFASGFLGFLGFSKRRSWKSRS